MCFDFLKGVHQQRARVNSPVLVKDSSERKWREILKLFLTFLTVDTLVCG